LVPYRGGDNYQTHPLAMTDGDPYIRALMRTITASESNVARPYHVLYGGKTVNDLSQHPEQCMPILWGPNRGNCSTAAGRYQFLNTTWAEKAKRYHPRPTGLLWWKTYSFEPFYQDKVVYHWLKDTQVWNADISQLLQKGQIKTVLRLLSGTWTSLGYGIENNSMSSRLPKIYQQMLAEELRSPQSDPTQPPTKP
jgi:muramidase (phage lysozyme)